MKKIITLLITLSTLLCSQAQSVKIYDESIDPEQQIKEAIAKGSSEGKFVVAQLGGNWCKWCIRFAKFVQNDPEIKKLVDENFEFIHVNYNPRNPETMADKTAINAALKKLGNPIRFGFPVLVVLDKEGNVIHTQDSGLLESGEGYDKEKVKRFFETWTPEAVNSSRL